MIEADLQGGSLLQAEIAVGQKPGQGTQSGPGAGSNTSAFAPSSGDTSNSADSSAHCGRFHHVPLTHALFFDRSLRIGLFGGMFPGHTGYRGDEGHLAVSRVDIIEA
jgi:hypothetical protein